MTTNYHKKFCLLCNKCNCLSDQSVSVFYNNAETSKDFYMEFSNDYYCKICKEITYQFDIEPGIAKSVRLLRIHGYDTVYSCEGHSKVIYENGTYTHDTSYPYICFMEKELPKCTKQILKAHGWNINTLNDVMLRLYYTMDEYETSNIQEYVNYHNDKFAEADKELFNALLEIFIDHDTGDD